VKPERNRGEQSDFGVGQPSPHLKQAMFEVDVGGFSLALSSMWKPSTTVRSNPHARSHTLLFCTLICSSWFRAFRQRENLEADRVQPVSTVSKPPTGTAEERHNGTYVSLLLVLKGQVGSSR